MRGGDGRLKLGAVLYELLGPGNNLAGRSVSDGDVGEAAGESNDVGDRLGAIEVELLSVTNEERLSGGIELGDERRAEELDARRPRP